MSCMSLPVWRDRVKRLATDPVVMRLSPATGHILIHVRCALLANHQKQVESTFVVVGLFIS